MKDLHIHTKYSDGEFDEQQILEEIESAGITEFAICDHDTITGSQKVFELLKKQNKKIIFHSGIELTCRLNLFNTSINMHILFYDFDYDCPALKEIISEISYSFLLIFSYFHYPKFKSLFLLAGFSEHLHN